jgi:hypothetical protein
MAETEFQKGVLDKLAKHFHIREQVGGKHFRGNRFRLDAVLTPREPTLWKSQDVALGVEFKDDLRISGDTTNYTKWLAQCVDYGHTEWDDFGYIFVFACPGIVTGIPGLKQGVGEMAWLLPRLMAHLGLGELKPGPYGWTFYLQADHRIWSEQEGVTSGKHWTLKRKFGSR